MPGSGVVPLRAMRKNASRFCKEEKSERVRFPTTEQGAQTEYK